MNAICTRFRESPTAPQNRSPSTGFIIPDRMQEVIGVKEVGLVEYRFQPDSFEVRHVRAPGQIDVGLDSLSKGNP